MSTHELRTVSDPVSRSVCDTVRILSPDLLHLGENVHIMDYAVIGVPNEDNEVCANDSERCVRIGAGTTLYPSTVVYEGATLGENVVMGEGTRVGSRTIIGDRTRVLYNAQVHDNVRVGSDCVIGGFIADNSSLGTGTSVFGALVHRYESRDPRSWAEVDEQGPTLGDNVLIAWGAVIVGSVTIGSGARIYPNSVVTRDVAKEEKFDGRWERN